jgi:hypothetical protein
VDVFRPDASRRVVETPVGWWTSDQGLNETTRRATLTERSIREGGVRVKAVYYVRDRSAS